MFCFFFFFFRRPSTALAGSSSPLSHVVAFGRHPAETAAQLTALGAGEAAATCRYNSFPFSSPIIDYWLVSDRFVVLHFLCSDGDSTGMGGAFSAVTAISPEDGQPALCEYLRYR